MRKLRLLSTMETPAGTLPAGEEIVVDEAEARLLLGARGLVEDLGVAPEAGDDKAPEAGDDKQAEPEASQRQRKKA